MFEEKYSRYVSRNVTRFAEDEEIIASAAPTFTSEKPAAGVPLCYKDGTLWVDPEDNHTFIVGPTGCKKTRVVANNTIASIIEAGESAVINDPKGELYMKTSLRAREKGAKVVMLNFRQPGKSQCWNPLTQVLRFYTEGKDDEAMQCINDFADAIIAPTLERTTDTYWGTTAKAFLVSIVLILLRSVPEEMFNLKTIVPFTYANAGAILTANANKMDQTSTAVFGLRSVLDLEAEKTKSCIYSTLLSALSPLVQNDKLLELLCCNSVNMEKMGEEQTLVYIIYPDEKDSLNFLVNLFITQCYETLSAVCADRADARLPVRVNFILDEFSNLCVIKNFANRISEARSKNIRYFLLVQSYGQLEEKYSAFAETILSNCTNWLCFSSKETAFLEKLEKICGNQTDFRGHSVPLISTSELQHLMKSKDLSEVLIIKQGQYPYVATLPDFESLEVSKNYRYAPPSEESEEDRTIATISPVKWNENILNRVFPLPYPKNV